MNHAPRGVASHDGRTPATTDEVTRVSYLLAALIAHRDALNDGLPHAAAEFWAVAREWSNH